MATVTGYTAEKMDEIVDDTVESATINGIGHLILNKHGGGTVDAGSAIGPPGPAGTDAVALRNIGELSIAVWELEAKVLAQDNAMVDWLGDPFVPGINRIASRTLDGSGYAILGIWRNVDRDQGFMGLDDFNPFAQYLDGLEVVKSGGISSTFGLVLSPDKKWAIAAGGATTFKVYPVTADGNIDNTVSPPNNTLAGGAQFVSLNFSKSSIKFTPDGKAIICLLNGTPFIQAYAFNTATGVVGAVAANPAVLMTQVAFGGFDISPNSAYVAIAGGETATPFMTVYAYNSTTNVWGAKSAAPATAPGATTIAVAFTEDGAWLLIANSTPSISAYAFNSGTGVIGAVTNATGTITGLQSFAYRSGKVVATFGSTPFVRGYNITAGVWSAQWAAPAALPTGTPGAFGISDGAALFYYYDGSITNTPQAYVLNASTFGAKITPTGIDTSFSVSGANTPWPIRNRDDVAFYTGASSIGVGLFGDPSGTTALTGQAQTITKTLAVACQSVFIIDSFSKSSANVTRQYDVSLDGGTTWNNNVPVNTVVLLPTPGTQLKVRITMTRTALGQSGQIFWFNVWAG